MGYIYLHSDKKKFGKLINMDKCVGFTPREDRNCIFGNFSGTEEVIYFCEHGESACQICKAIVEEYFDKSCNNDNVVINLDTILDNLTSDNKKET